jgi:hypothetical protein
MDRIVKSQSVSAQAHGKSVCKIFRIFAGGKWGYWRSAVKSLWVL